MGREAVRVVEVIDLENGGNLLPTRPRMKIPCRGSIKKQVIDLSDEEEDNDQVLEIKPTDFKYFSSVTGTKQYSWYRCCNYSV